MEKVVTLPKSTKDIGETLSNKHAEEKSDNRDCLRKILSSLRFLGRQGLPIRGHVDEADGSYIQLLTLLKMHKIAPTNVLSKVKR